MQRAPVFAIGLALLLLASIPGLAQEPAPTGGRPVSFPLTLYNDTLFANVDVAYRAAFDDDGDLWYTTTAGVVHLLLDERTREIYTKMEGLPSSLALGLAIRGDVVYAGTDLGLAIINRSTGNVTALTTLNSQIPDDIVREVAIDGEKVWIGSQFHGVAQWDPATDSWVEHNTSTTAGVAKPVRRIVPTEKHVWVTTDGDGVWRYERATKNWTVLLKSDGLPSNTVLSVAERGQNVYFGTDRGIARWAPYAPFNGTANEWLVYNQTSGMPDDRAFDLDLIPVEAGGDNLFAATRSGLWQLDPESGQSVTRAQDFGILGSYIFDTTYDDERGWVVATTRGLSLLRGGTWDYFATGPTLGATNGPVSYRFTGATWNPDADYPYVWIGSDEGISAFDPAAGKFYNLGEWTGYPGGPVNHMFVVGNTTWMATNFGAFGYNVETNEWIHREIENSRNLVYGMDVAHGEIWVGAFGDGLIMQNLTTGIERSWTYESLPEPIPDEYITDVRVAVNDVWLGSSIGVIRMDRLSGTFKGTYTQADGIPGKGVVFRTLPDGLVTWIGMREGGIARLDVAAGKVTKVWNATTVPGFPDTEVRALHREGAHLWAGTKAGLVRIDVSTGDVKWYNQSNSDLVQEFVSGVTVRDGVAYLATASGLARFDIATETFLPMRDGPGITHGGGNLTSTPRSPLSVRIDSPRDGVGVTGTVDVRGTATRFGGRVERVEVRIGQGPWQTAEGTESWTIPWDTTGATPNQPVTLAARAISGADVSREAVILVTPVELPKTPLQVQHSPIHAANAGRPLLIAAQITGDEPLTATLSYKVPGRDAYTRVPLARQGSLFSATIPGKDVQQGNLTYYIAAQSGLLEVTSPDDPVHAPHRVEVGPPARLAVAVEAPALVEAHAGNDTRFALNVTNVGTEPATYTIAASGIRASWVTVQSEAITLEPGESREVPASIRVPVRAFADNTTLSFEVTEASGTADPAEADVPIQIFAAPPSSLPPTDAPTKPTPAPGALAFVLALALALALVRRRRP